MRKFIVMVSPSYGGAEKRFFDVFTSLARSHDDVMFIAPARLIQRFKLDHPDRRDVFAFLLGLQIEKWSPLAFVLALRRLLRTLPKGATYHYPLNCLWPLHLGRGDSVSMSMVDCTRVPALFGGTVASAWSWFSFFYVAKIDVLNPSIYEALQSYSTSSRMSLTPGGTYLVPSTFRVVSKEPTVVLLSRLIQGKGVEDFIDVLPSIWNNLRKRGALRVAFQIAGYGSLEPWVVSRVEALTEMGVPISFIGYSTADDLFPVSSVVLSMQDITNYPSRVVAEALMAGCGVIVRDTGDSRKFGNDVTGLLYCGAKLDAIELAGQIEFLLKRVLHEVGFQDSVHSVANCKFSSTHYIDYFSNLFNGSAVVAVKETGKHNLEHQGAVGTMNRPQTGNIDAKTVNGFGDEWERFDQTGMTDSDSTAIFESYFSIFPWHALSENAVGFDLGCGSGRWAKMVAPRIGKLHCIDPSVAINVARKNLADQNNCEFHNAGVDDIPVADHSMDFGYSLGVLHHIPDSSAALAACVAKLKPGAPFLLYLYYAFDNRPTWFRLLWKLSELIRTLVSRMPNSLRFGMSQIIAALIYWPLARLAKSAEFLNIDVKNYPLSIYRNRGFYVMRTDALDRFGTRLEQRFTRIEIQQMMEAAGLDRIVFSDKTPFWCAVGFAKAER